MLSSLSAATSGNYTYTDNGTSITITGYVTKPTGASASHSMALAAAPISSNAALAGLSISAGSLSPSFAAGNRSYSVSVANAVASIQVTPTAMDATALVTVQGTELASGAASAAIPLTVGSNVIAVVVTAQNGSAVTTQITVTRAISTVSTLSGLALSSGSLSPDFAAGTMQYAASVANSVSSLKVTPTVTDSVASVKVNAVAVNSGEASASIPLVVGANDIAVEVTAQDGVSVSKYSVTVMRKTLGPTGFALIPAGSFTMGDISDNNQDGDAPAHTVNISPFYMAKNLSTKDEWDRVRIWALNHGYSDLSAGSGKGITHPVQTVSWYDMLKYCNARSEQEGLTPVYYTDDAQTVVYKTGNLDLTNAQVKWHANGYRLPTEAEWEKAARGGLIGKRFPWGDTISHQETNFYNTGSQSYQTGTIGYHPTYATGSMPYTSPVGSFAANGYGLYDMAGNVSQWCWDWSENYDTATPTDPHGQNSGTHRVGRGGSWLTEDGGSVGSRDFSGGIPSEAYWHFGFRVARSSSIESTLAGLELNSGSLSPSFAASIMDYSVSVMNSTNSIKLTLTVSDAIAKVKVNGGDVVSGAVSAAIPLNVGSNTITVQVTAPDGTFNSYTVVVTRAAGEEVVSGYRAWIGTYAGLASQDAAADPDKDGIPNLLEYVLNGDPGVASASILPIVTKELNRSVFQFSRRASSAGDTTQVFQYSTDLVHWTDVNVTAPMGTEVTLGATDNNGVQRVTIAVPNGVSGQMFGRIRVTEASATVGYTAWVALQPGLLDATAAGDPDKDGIPNLLEYVLNGNPAVASSAVLPVVSQNTSSFLFSFSRAVASAADTTQVFQYSSDLVSWTDVSLTPPTDSKVTLGAEDGAGIQPVTVTIPKQGASAMFGRLKVTQP
jgi:formylglycine-generating enzyme required for sulfatase activity